MESSRRQTVHLTIIICYVLVVSKLFYWQVVKSPEFFQNNSNQNYQPSIIEPQKGRIFDSLGYPLALNETSYQLSIYKPDLKIPVASLEATIVKVHPVLSSEGSQQLQKFVANPSQKWITLKKEFFTFPEIQQLTDTGFSFSPITRRYFPEEHLAQSLLLGLDGYYKKQISGKPGFNWQTVDATGKTVLAKSGWQTEAVDGRDLHTSLNRHLQFIIEQALKSGLENYSADSGSIIVMSPQTGAILASSSIVATSSAQVAYVNPTISHLFEPGSIFKPLVMSMALDSGAINSNYICSKCGSPHSIGQYQISNWDNSFHPNTDLQDIIKNSDNIGMSYIVEQLGLPKFLNYFRSLGLEEKTGIDLSGETKPLHKDYWPDIDLATASFGQGFAITQIQMITAFNVLANNGLLVKPRIVDYFEINNSQLRLPIPPTQTIFKTSTVSKMKQILKYSVENGVVAKFKPENIEVCAKSGTSQVAVKGGYSDSSTIASYIGFSPCNNPAFTMIVTINNPRTSPWGSSTAAPIWYDIAKKIKPLL